jgi:hypothetical protein
MPHRFSSKLSLLGIAAALAICIGLLRLNAAILLLIPPLLGMAWWGQSRWRELRLWRGTMAAMPYRMAIYAADQRLIWHNARPGSLWMVKIAGLGPRPNLRAVLRAVLAHLPEPEREAEFNRRLAHHDRANGGRQLDQSSVLWFQRQ